MSVGRFCQLSATDRVRRGPDAYRGLRIKFPRALHLENSPPSRWANPTLSRAVLSPRTMSRGRNHRQDNTPPPAPSVLGIIRSDQMMEQVIASPDPVETAVSKANTRPFKITSVLTRGRRPHSKLRASRKTSRRSEGWGCGDLPFLSFFVLPLFTPSPSPTPPGAHCDSPLTDSVACNGGRGFRSASMAASADGDERVMAAAQQIVKSLGTSKNAKEDMILILSSFDNRLSNITDLLSGGGTARGGRLEGRFEGAERVITRWGDSTTVGSVRGFIPWEDSPEEAVRYLAAVDDVISLTEEGEGEQEAAAWDAEMLDRAERVLQMAMDRLEDEFRHIVVQNAVPLDAARLYGSIRRMSLSFSSDGGEIEEFGSWEEDPAATPTLEERSTGGSLSRDLLGVDLVRPEAVPHLKNIAERMIRARYEKECCQSYISVRRDLLDECLAILGVEKISIEEVQRIEWKELDEKMRRWVHAVKVVVQGLLLGEKLLCDQIFEVSPLIADVCFTETAKGCVMQLLNFAEAVAIGQRSPERLFRILNMYDALSNVMPDLQAQFPEEARGFLCGEAEIILKRLGDAARGTLAEFENAVQRESSRQLMQFGDIHPLTRYVMNYVKLLVDYTATLNGLLDESGTTAGVLPENKNDGESECAENMSPLGRHVLSTVSCLESNIEEKSKLYEDSGLQFVFLMNNILYMVQKVKDSELGVALGDEWVRKRRGQIRQYARSYLRASWTKVLQCLKDEGIVFGGSSSNASKAALKEKFKNFNMTFEEVYRYQMTWKVPDPQLREELRISISEKVIPAYRSFMGRFGGQLEGGRHAAKYIKYTPEDLEKYLEDLFEGDSEKQRRL
ncbi:hypothetical protein Taro_007805 [Colocasia esculenta]|uniref:Exocyst subunit Exo70 family protein n=1 Tax=Colocasia esculenta TaxID=4460 RepID=A0A843U1G1_COLES|nr:hypothetical protein [Colocasia esculenta]